MNKKVTDVLAYIESLNLNDDEIIVLRSCIHTSVEKEEYGKPFEDGPWNESKEQVPHQGYCEFCGDELIGDCTCGTYTLVEDYEDSEPESSLNERVDYTPAICSCDICGEVFDSYKGHHCQVNPDNVTCINCYAPISECTCKSTTFNAKDY